MKLVQLFIALVGSAALLTLLASRIFSLRSDSFEQHIADIARANIEERGRIQW